MAGHAVPGAQRRRVPDVDTPIQTCAPAQQQLSAPRRQLGDQQSHLMPQLSLQAAVDMQMQALVAIHGYPAVMVALQAGFVITADPGSGQVNLQQPRSFACSGLHSATTSPGRDSMGDAVMEDAHRVLQIQ